MLKGNRRKKDKQNDKTGQKETKAFLKAAAVYGWQLKIVQLRI